MSRSSALFTRLGRPTSILAGLSVLAVGSVLAWVGETAADPTGPQGGDHNVTMAVTLLLKRQHLSRHPLDDEIAHRWLTMYLKTLDPMKVYFMESDVEAFKRHQDALDDEAKKGNIAFGYQVFQTFLKRIDERIKMVDELLAMPHDFNVNEEMITDPEQTKYAKDEAQIRDIWRKRIKYDLLVLKSADKEKDRLEGKAAIEKLTRRYHSFGKRMHQTDNDELLEMYLTSLTTSYDPHTTYMSPSSLENFEIQMRLNLEGIGAALQYVDGYTQVSKIIPGGAAAKDKRLKHMDKVIGVGQGEDGEIVDVQDMKLNDVVKRIRGKQGTVVRLEVIPEGTTEKKIYNITRAQIELTDAEARSKIFEEGKKADGTPYLVGVINLPSFYMDMNAAREGSDDFKSTTRDVAKLLKEFNDRKVDVCILDLQHNGGGSLTEAINLTGLFIDTGPVVQVKDADGLVQHYDDMDRGMAWNGPLVVLTSKFSASASEIFAGAIQDYKRGLIVGDPSTHGKGTVQSLLNLSQQLFRVPNAPQLGALKITMQQFYRPNGDSTQNRGVLADVELPSLSSQFDMGESSLDYALKFDHVQALQYPKLNLVDTPLIEQLRNLSADRRKQSKDFDKVLRNIIRFNEQKKKPVSVNEKKFLADRAELNAEKEEEKELDNLDDASNEDVFKDTFYTKEVRAIATDYFRLLKMPHAGAVGQK